MKGIIQKIKLISFLAPESSLFQIRGGAFSTCSEWTVSKTFINRVQYLIFIRPLQTLLLYHLYVMQLLQLLTIAVNVTFKKSTLQMNNYIVIYHIQL